MSKIKMLNATAVGGLIEGAFKAADDAGQVVHKAAIQCLLHLQAHGDATLIERLVDGLETRSMNMRGLRFWAGTFTPATQRAGKWGLLDKDGEAYAKYVERCVEAYGDGELGVGDRLFWIDAADENPYWTLEKVQEDNGRNITRLTTATLFGQVIGLEGRLDKATDKGTFVGDTVLADAFIEHMKASAEAFRKEHKAEFKAEQALLKAAKDGDMGNENVADAAAQPPGAIIDEQQPGIDVGGKVEEGLTGDPVDDEAANKAA